MAVAAETEIGGVEAAELAGGRGTVSGEYREEFGAAYAVVDVDHVALSCPLYAVVTSIGFSRRDESLDASTFAVY